MSLPPFLKSHLAERALSDETSFGFRSLAASKKYRRVWFWGSIAPDGCSNFPELDHERCCICLRLPWTSTTNGLRLPPYIDYHPSWCSTPISGPSMDWISFHESACQRGSLPTSAVMLDIANEVRKGQKNE